MGTTLYNKIPLGRASALSSKRLQAFLLASAILGMGLAWMGIQAIKG